MRYWSANSARLLKTAQANLVVRALGPSLGSAGLAGALQDPTLDLHDGNGAIIASNDNWKDTQQSEIQATGLAPSDELVEKILARAKQSDCVLTEDEIMHLCARASTTDE